MPEFFARTFRTLSGARAPKPHALILTLLGALVFSVLPGQAPAGAAGVPQVTAPTNTVADASLTQTTLTGMTVGHDNDTDVLRVFMTTTKGGLYLPTQDGLTFDASTVFFGSPLSFTGTRDAINTALAAATIQGTNAATTGNATVGITAGVVGAATTSTASSVIPMFNVPGRPTMKTAATDPDGILVTWTAPTSTGGSPITAYDFVLSTSNGSDVVRQSCAGDLTSCVITGLGGGLRYNVYGYARNAVGQGLQSTQTNVAANAPNKIPGTVQNAKAEPTGVSGQLKLSWTAPAADRGSSAVTNYRYRLAGATTYSTINALSVLVSPGVNLQPATYQVWAINAATPTGTTGDANAVSVTGTPDAIPTGVLELKGTVENTATTLTWKAPAPGANPGSPVSGYDLRRDGESTWQPLDVSSDPDTGLFTYRVTGLTNLTTYKFYLRARNAAGVATVTPSVTVVPNTVPGPVLNLKNANPGRDFATITWEAPAVFAGSAVTEYQYRAVGETSTTDWQRAFGTSTTVQFLKVGEEYQLQVRAVNAAGPGAPASVRQYYDEVPLAPSNIVATVKDSSATVTFDPPPASTYSSAVTRYEWQFNGDGNSWTDLGTSRSFVVDHLENNKQYYVNVRAVNRAGAGNQNQVGIKILGTPGKVTDLKGTPGDRRATFAWSEPAGANPVSTDYEWRYAGAGDDAWARTQGAPSLQLMFLTNGAPVTIEVRARNAAGPGPIDSVTVTPDVAPAGVRNLAAEAGNTKATLTWDAPEDNGGTPVTKYQYQVLNGEWIDNGTSRSVTLTGLSNGTLYWYAVRAVNAAGPGDAVAVSVRPFKPMVPLTLDLTATPGDRSVTVTWDPPTNPGGAAVAHYEYQLSDALTWTDNGTKTSATITGLTNGKEVLVYVRSVDVDGNTHNYDWTRATPNLLPGPVTLLEAARGDRKVQLYWSQPVANGGTAVYKYEYRQGTSGPWLEVQGIHPTTSVTGLTNGVSYDFQVRAVNAMGGGEISDISAIPDVVPDAVRHMKTEAGDRSATVTWEAPSPNGGTPLTGYQWRTDIDPTWHRIAADATSVTITDLVDDPSQPPHYFDISPLNAAGEGAGAFITIHALTPPTVPTPVTNLEGTTDDHTGTVTWDVPGSDGGRPITRYEYKTRAGNDFFDPSGDTGWTSTQLLSKVALPDLPYGETMRVYVRAVNEVGASLISVTYLSPVWPATPLGPVTNLEATPGDGVIDLSWGDLADRDAHTPGYYFEYRVGDGPWTYYGLQSSPRLTGLTNGIPVTVTVRGNTGTTPGPERSVTATPVAAPDAPVLSVTPGDGQLTATFTTPKDNGSTILGYKLTYFDGWSTFKTIDCPKSPCTVDGLVNGRPYGVRVVAVNGIGPSADSNTVWETPRTVPGLVQELKNVAGDKSAKVTWRAPVSDGGSAITSYWITVGDGNPVEVKTPADKDGVFTYDATGLTNDETYGVDVWASNAVGDGPKTDTTAKPVKPAAKPSKPTITSATPGNGQVVLTFTDPEANGSPITGRTISWIENGEPKSQKCSSPCTITGLTNGRSYQFVLTVTNEVGDSPASDPKSATPLTFPGPVHELAAVGGDGTAKITWKAPTSDGGSPIGLYFISIAGEPLVQFTGRPDNQGVFTYDASGLTNGRPYPVTVWPLTQVGAGPQETTTVTPAKPAAKPSTPTITSATPGDGQVTLTFTDPESNGSGITERTISWMQNDQPKTQKCSSPCTITGLANGTSYSFTLTVANGIGTSEPSDPKDATPVAPKPAATVPGPVNELKAAAGDTTAKITWKTPTDDGGSPITKYLLTIGSAGPFEVAGAPDKDGHFTYDATKLDNGTSYDVKVWAANDIGEGPKTGTDVKPVKPASRPSKPTITSATPGNGQVVLTFTDPETNGSPLTKRTISWTENGEPKSKDCSSPCTITGLSNGTSYSFTLTVANGIGTSEPSDPQDAKPVAPAPTFTVPGSVQELKQVSGDGKADLTWKAPASDGGAKITGYQIKVGNGDWATVVPDPIGGVYSASVPGLTNGSTYDVQVRAVNDAGAGPATSVKASPIKKAGKPGAPRDVKATVTGTSALVTWLAPLSDGGSPIVDYVVTTTDPYNPKTCIASAMGLTACTITGLTPGKTYTFNVVARNTKVGVEGTGTGPAAQSPKVCVQSVPGAPTGLKGTGGDRTLSLTWTAPANPGTSAIKRYEVSLDGGKTWKQVTTTGSSTLSTTITGVRNGTSYNVRVRAVNRSGAGSSSAQVCVPTKQWYADPLSYSQRSSLATIPSNPSYSTGSLRWTKAKSTSYVGTPVMDAGTIGGRQLQSGQGALLVGEPLFTSTTSSSLSSTGTSQLQSLAGSLRYVTAVTCEGYGDYAGSSSMTTTLTSARSKAVCDALKTYGAKVTTTVKGYGTARPVLIGGAATDRAANRRVVVLATAG